MSGWPRMIGMVLRIWLTDPALRMYADMHMPLLRPKYFEGGILRTIPSPSVTTMSGKRYNIAEVTHLAPVEAKTDSKTAVKLANKSSGKRIELVPLSTMALQFGRCKEPFAP